MTTTQTDKSDDDSLFDFLDDAMSIIEHRRSPEEMLCDYFTKTSPQNMHSLKHIVESHIGYLVTLRASGVTLTRNSAAGGNVASTPLPLSDAVRGSVRQYLTTYAATWFDTSPLPLRPHTGGDVIRRRKCDLAKSIDALMALDDMQELLKKLQNIYR